MTRPPLLKIRQLEFTSITKATNHFMDQREKVNAEGPVTAGDLFEELKELYARYCEVSPGWELNGRNIVAFIVDYELRQNVRYAQHLCFKVVFSNKEVRPFSVKEAVKAIVKTSAEAGQ